MKKSMLIALVSVAIAGCNSVKIKHVSSTKKLKNEYYYVLPKTAFTFEVPVQTNSYKAGKDTKEAAAILSNTAVVNYCVQRFGLDKDVFEKLVKGQTVASKSEISAITFSTVAKPDFKKIFKVKARHRFMNEHSAGFTYAGDGIASQSDLSHQNNTLSTTGKILEGIVSIIGATKNAAPTPTLSLDAYPTLKSLDELTTKYISLQVSPPDVIDPVVYKENLQTLEGMIRKKFAQVFYTEKTEIKILKIVYCPSSPEIKTQKLFKLDGTNIVIDKGIEHDVEVFGLASYMFAAINDDVCYQLSLAGKNNGLGDYIEPYDISMVSGYVYNLPASFIVAVKDESQKLVVSQQVKLPQYGTMGSVSKKQSKVSIEWNTETGELKKIAGESKGVSGDNISGGASAAVSAIDAIRGDDETTQLEKEVKLLELKKKRDELKAAGID